MYLSTEELEPRLLRAGKFDFYTENMRELKLIPRRCYDYELEFYTASQGGVIIDGEYVEFGPGDLNLRKPGQVVCGVPPYGGYIVCFSLDKQPKNLDGYLFGCPEEAEPSFSNTLLDRIPPRITPKNREGIRSVIRELCRTSLNTDALNRFRAKSLLYSLLSLLFSECEEVFLYNRKVILAAEYIRDNFLEPIAVEDLIEYSGLSKAYFHKCFKSYTKTTPVGLMTALRMERAKTLLHLTEDSIGDIAAACGYLDHVYFSHLFKKTVGQRPTEYRNRIRATG